MKEPKDIVVIIPDKTYQLIEFKQEKNMELLL